MRGRQGVALILAVFLGLGGIALAHGILVLSRHELLAARAGRDLLLAKVARDRVWRAWWVETLQPGSSPRRILSDSVPDAPVGSVVSLVRGDLSANVRAQLRARRLSEELWWIEAEGKGGRTSDRTGRVVRQLDLDAEVEKVGAAIETVGPAPGVPTDPVGAACPTSWRGPARSGSGPIAPEVSGWLLPGAVAGWATRLPHVNGPVGSLDSSGPCGEGWNWGAGPGCSVPGVALYSPYALTLEGGEGTAALFVRGDLELRRTILRGHVVVEGSLHLSDGAEFIGIARVGDSVSVARGSRVEGSLCWAREALRRSPASAPYPLPGSGWIRPAGLR